MKKADYALLARILKKYNTDAKISLLYDPNNESAKWIAVTCETITIDFMRGASVNKVEFYKACTPD